MSRSIQKYKQVIPDHLPQVNQFSQEKKLSTSNSNNRQNTQNEKNMLSQTPVVKNNDRNSKIQLARNKTFENGKQLKEYGKDHYKQNIQMYLQQNFSKEELQQLSQKKEEIWSQSQQDFYEYGQSKKQYKQQELIKYINQSNTSFVLPIRQEEKSKVFGQQQSQESWFIYQEQTKYDNKQILEMLHNNEYEKEQLNKLHQNILFSYDKNYFDRRLKVKDMNNNSSTNKQQMSKSGFQFRSKDSSSSKYWIGFQGQKMKRTGSQNIKNSGQNSGIEQIGKKQQKSVERRIGKIGNKMWIKDKDNINKRTFDRKKYEQEQQELDIKRYNEIMKRENIENELESNMQQKIYVNKFYESLLKIGKQKVQSNVNEIMKVNMIIDKQRRVNKYRSYKLQNEDDEDSNDLSQEQFKIDKTNNGQCYQIQIYSQQLEIGYKWNPECRESGGMLIIDKCLYLYGGVGNQLNNQISLYDIQGDKWRNFDNNFEGRYGHCMQKFQGKIVLFGGQNYFNISIRQRECFNDVKVFDIDNKSLWKMRCSGEIPEPIRNCACFIFEKYLGIHGGINSKGTYQNQLFMLDMLNYKWELVDYQVFIAEYNNQLYNNGVAFHQMVSVYRSTKKKNQYMHDYRHEIKEEGIYTFGGRSSRGQYEYDLLIFKTDQQLFRFVKAQTQGQPPTYRSQHQMVYNNHLNYLVIYGGKQNIRMNVNSNDYENPFISNELNILQLHNLQWMHVITKNGQLEAKAAHSMVSYEQELIIFGGFNQQGLISPKLQFIYLNEKKATILYNQQINRTRFQSGDEQKKLKDQNNLGQNVQRVSKSQVQMGDNNGRNNCTVFSRASYIPVPDFSKKGRKKFGELGQDDKT